MFRIFVIDALLSAEMCGDGGQFDLTTIFEAYL